MIIAFLNMIFTPYYYAFFPLYQTSVEENIIKIVTIIFYIVDIMANFRTSYLDEMGNEVTDIEMVKKEYINSTLIFDVIAILPWEYLFINHPYLVMLRNIKFTRIWKLNQIISYL